MNYFKDFKNINSGECWTDANGDWIDFDDNNIDNYPNDSTRDIKASILTAKGYSVHYDFVLLDRLLTNYIIMFEV